MCVTSESCAPWQPWLIKTRFQPARRPLAASFCHRRVASLVHAQGIPATAGIHSTSCSRRHGLFVRGEASKLRLKEFCRRPSVRCHLLFAYPVAHQRREKRWTCFATTPPTLLRTEWAWLSPSPVHGLYFMTPGLMNECVAVVYNCVVYNCSHFVLQSCSETKSVQQVTTSCCAGV